MAFLLGMSGKGKGMRCEIDRDEFTIGRRDSNNLALDDPSVSGIHCSIVRDGRKYRVRDLGSTNGTQLNGTPVQEKSLNPKDILHIGNVEFLFDGDDVEPSTQTNRTTAQIEVSNGGPVTVPNTFRNISPFGTRRDSRRVWFGLIAIIGLIALVMLALFFFRLFQ